jgi:hypothetical protein
MTNDVNKDIVSFLIPCFYSRAAAECAAERRPAEKTDYSKMQGK